MPQDQVTRWARQAVDGSDGVVVGELVRYAAERHLRDLVDGPSRGLHWAPDRALRVLRFFPALFSITAGAKAGARFDLLPWQMFCVGSLFGWHNTSGRLRFRNAWLETGKGQAKSPLMGAIGLYMMGWHGIPRSEVYSIGWDKRTANVLFRDAVSMCRTQIPDQDMGDTLASRGQVIIRGFLGNAWKIEHPETESHFQALANTDSISGPRPSLVAADEIHEFKSDDPLKTWRQAITKQAGDAMLLMGTNTPASSQLVGTEYSDQYQKIAKGEIFDDEAFSFIARVDHADRETVFDNEACWIKSLPALGITFPVENIRGEVASAKTKLSTAMAIKRLYFGIPTGSVDFWIDEDSWVNVQGEVDEKKLAGCKCWLSLDLADKNDLTALTAVWQDDAGHLWAKTWYWTIRHKLADRALADHAAYAEWADDPNVEFTAIDSETVDKTFIAAKVAEFVSAYHPEYMAFDVAGMGDFIAACERNGFPVWKYEGPDKPDGQGFKLVAHAQGPLRKFEGKQLVMPVSIERLEDVILEKKITIDASPVTYFCAGNAFVNNDGLANRYFDKKRSRGRIDGIVTLAMAVGAASFEMTAPVKEYQVLFV
ncbi:terminase TerL endonuclease subunit [Bradyrhizobium sp. 150]|uniref:terminase large subunit n=1 Tax=Bradyrhizobium sp. 150 TaxID=2782625 RepID=UPI001FFB8573|nr:terminase TerL endonuclease subunit [Bradyrhizobium sp. 150]